MNVFDWLRERVYNNNDKAKNFSAGTYVVNKKYVDKIIKEVEDKCGDIEQDAYERGYKLGYDKGYSDGEFFEKAKWEAKVCEYEYHVAPSKDIYFLTSCKNRHNGRLSANRPYCGFCGKPIKIVEVE